MIRRCTSLDFGTIYEILNDASQAYKGIIPDDRWHEPYMSRDQLAHEIEATVVFWGIELDGQLACVMGIHDKGEVVLIRHAYVRTKVRNQGIGTELLQYLENTTDKPILIGTWADASWAVCFYRKNGYRLDTEQEKNHLLRKFWSIPERQIETSVVRTKSEWST